jgi:general secretion pathway protein G
MERERRTKENGFTLVELMLVVTIIGILAGAVLLNISGQSKRAKIQRAKSDIASISSALSLYEMAVGDYPDELKDLVEDPGEQGWDGPYVTKKNFLDPWGNEYQYQYPGSSRGVEYDLYSLGPDQQDGSDDDIGNWEEEST